MTTIASKKLEVDSCSLHFLDGGKGQNIVLLHGMKFQAATWQELGTLDFLADSGNRALALDMPGFGRTPECALEQDTVLAEFVQQETSGSPVLIGPSMGGRIALEFTLNHPDKVSGLILVGAVGVEENRPRLAEIKVPTLLLWGGDDQISPLANSDVLLNSIAGARRVIIEGAPHPCYLDNTEKFHQAVGDFLATLS